MADDVSPVTIRAVDIRLLAWMLLRPMKNRIFTPLMTAAVFASVTAISCSEETSDVKPPAAEPKEVAAQPEKEKTMPEAPSDVAAPPADAEKTESGLASKVLKAGTGDKKPAAADTVTVHYTGWTTDGKQFDSSVERGQPASFPLNGVIKGWTEGLQLMVEGEKRRFWIPRNWHTDLKSKVAHALAECFVLMWSCLVFRKLRKQPSHRKTPKKPPQELPTK